MTFRKPDLRPSSGNEAPELEDPLGRAVPGHWMMTEEMQERTLCG